MADPDVIALEIFFDYHCPFVFRMARLLDAVRESGKRRLQVEWRYFSLSQVNSKDNGWTVWDAPPSTPVKGRLAFKAAEAARRQGKFDALHMLLLEARHKSALDIDAEDVVEQVAESAGLDRLRFRDDLADPRILDALARDHRRAANELGVFGTPTLVFAGGAAAYVRLARDHETGSALEVFDRLLAVAEDEPRILEIKRPVRPSPTS